MKAIIGAAMIIFLFVGIGLAMGFEIGDVETLKAFAFAVGVTAWGAVAMYLVLEGRQKRPRQ